MRFIVYNVAYGTGSPGKAYKRLFTSHRYIRTNGKYFARITRFIKEQNPDVVGLIEVDNGSFRTNQTNQVQHLADKLDHHHVCQSKYSVNSVVKKVPILRNQVNAILSSRKDTYTKFHFFPRGMKKMVIETEINGVVFFIVHLSLRKNTRSVQLDFLSHLIPDDKPVIIGGDFNCFSGHEELRKMCDAKKLINSNKKMQATYPSWNPKKQLDFILHSRHVVPKEFKVLSIQHSDHLPLMLDFEVREKHSI